MKNGSLKPEPVKEPKVQQQAKIKAFESMTNLNSRQLIKLNKSAKRLTSKKDFAGIVVLRSAVLKTKKTMMDLKSKLPEVPGVPSMMAKAKSDTKQAGILMKK